VRASIVELEAGARDEISRRRANENLLRVREGHDAGSDVNRDSARFFAGPALDLSCVHPSPHIEPERSECLADGQRTADRPSRTVEESEKSVTRGVDLLTREAHELTSNCFVMLVEEL
jgi:hypothetical protein